MTAVARLYVSKLRKGLDPALIPVFPPNTLIQVGSVGTVADGRFTPRGSLTDFGVDLKVVPEAAPADVDYSATGKVKVGPTVKVPAPTGGELASATLTFTDDEAVVATFSQVRAERAVLKEFDRVLYEQLAAGNLSTGDVVAWSVAVAEAGTVIVALQRGASVDVQAPISGAIGLGTLALGVSFSNDTGVAAKISSKPMSVSVRLRRVTPDARTPVGDVLGLEPPAGTFTDVLVDDLLV